MNEIFRNKIRYSFIFMAKIMLLKIFDKESSPISIIHRKSILALNFLFYNYSQINAK